MHSSGHVMFVRLMYQCVLPRRMDDRTRQQFCCPTATVLSSCAAGPSIRPTSPIAFGQNTGIEMRVVFLFFAFRGRSLGVYGPKLTICNSRRRQHDDRRPAMSAHQGALKRLSYTPIAEWRVRLSRWIDADSRPPASLPRRRPPSPAVFRPPRPRPGLGLRLLFLLLRARGFPRFSLNRGPPSCSSSRALRSLFEWGFLLPTFVSDVRLQARTEFRRFPRPSFLPRSGGSSSSCPFWAAPAPSAFTAWSGAQPFPAVPSGSIRSPSLPAALHLASPGFLPAALFFATVSLPDRFRSRQPPHHPRPRDAPGFPTMFPSCRNAR